MTVVAWDGKTLAADKRAVQASQAYPVTKIFQLDADRLAGIGGHLSRGLAIIRWLKGGRDHGEFPKEEPDQWVNVIVIHRMGRVERYESHPEPIVHEAPFCAIGSGRDFAVAAMHLGLDARAAVELTCQYSADCGNGIDVLTFSTP